MKLGLSDTEALLQTPVTYHGTQETCLPEIWSDGRVRECMSDRQDVLREWATEKVCKPQNWASSCCNKHDDKRHQRRSSRSPPSKFFCTQSGVIMTWPDCLDGARLCKGAGWRRTCEHVDAEPETR